LCSLISRFIKDDIQTTCDSVKEKVLKLLKGNEVHRQRLAEKSKVIISQQKEENECIKSILNLSFKVEDFNLIYHCSMNKIYSLTKCLFKRSLSLGFEEFLLHLQTKVLFESKYLYVFHIY
jgi:hypothetical protein